MISSDDLALILLLAKEKSLAAVARASHISPSAISQRLTALEAKLGIRIAERVGRSGVVLTVEGEFLAERGELVMADLKSIDDQLSEQKGVVAGHLNIVAPLGFGRTHLAPLVGKFHESHPDVSIALSLSDTLGRIPDGSWDIFIRVGPLHDSSLVMKKLANNKRLLCAAPAYIDKHGAPKHPDDLSEHNCIVIHEDEEDASLWRFCAKNGNRKDVRVRPILSTNDGEVALSWALAGRGIIVRSEWSAAGHIASGKLRQLLPSWRLPEAPVIALTSGPRGRAGRVQAMLDFLESELKLI